MAKITAFETGWCTHISCIALKGAGLKVCKFPARAWLLEVGDKRWLWDTGYSSWFEHYTQSGVFRLYRQVTPVYFDPQQGWCDNFLPPASQRKMLMRLFCRIFTLIILLACVISLMFPASVLVKAGGK